jgi:hypothetical protein
MMRRIRMRKSKKSGAVVILLLSLSLIVFLLVSLALTSNYRLHVQNRKVAEELQSRAELVSFQ